MKGYNKDHCAVFVTTNTFKRNKIFSYNKYAQIIVDALRFGNRHKWYQLISYVVMPDHLHFVVIPQDKNLPDTMKAIKGFTSRQINLLRKSSNHIWQRDYYVLTLDKIEFVHQKIKYIENNPVRSGLVDNSIDYQFSSAGKYNDLDLSSLY